MKLVIEKSYWDDVVNLRHPETLEVIAKQIRRNGVYVWKSEDPNIQKLCDEWSGGTTIGGMASLIADVLRCN